MASPGIDPEVANLLESASDDELLAFAELYEDGEDETTILLSVCALFHAFNRLGNSEYLVRARARSEQLLAMTANDSPFWDGRNQILSAMTARLSELEEEQEQIADLAVTMGLNVDAVANEPVPKQLDLFIEHAKTQAEAVPQGDTNRRDLVMQYYMLLESRYNGTRTLSDLEQLIQLGEELLELPSDDPKWQHAWLIQLTKWNGERYFFHGQRRPEDFHRAVDMTNRLMASAPSEFRLQAMDSGVQGTYEALAATALDDPDRNSYLVSLGTYLLARCNETGAVENVDQAIEAMSPALDDMVAGHTDQLQFIEVYTKCLYKRFAMTQTLDNLDRAIELAKVALNGTQSPQLSGQLSLYLAERFRHTRTIGDFHEAIDIIRATLRQPRNEETEMLNRLFTFGGFSGSSPQHSGNSDLARQVIDILQQAFENSPTGHTLRPWFLLILGLWYGRKHLEGEIDDFTLAASTVEEALAISPSDNTCQAACWNSLGQLLSERFEQLGSLDDIDQAVQYAKKASESAPHDHVERRQAACNIGIWTNLRARATESYEDVDAAVEALKGAVSSIHFTDHDYYTCLFSLILRLGTRYDTRGSLQDLHASIDILSRALEHLPSIDRYRTTILATIGELLCKRYIKIGAVEDLDRAMELTTIVMHEYPAGSEEHTICLANLSWQLAHRPGTGNGDQLDRAIEAARAAFDATSDGDRFFYIRAGILAEMFQSRYVRDRIIDDLDEAELFANVSVATAPSGGKEKAWRLYSLANILRDRAVLSTEWEDLDKAIETARESASLSGVDDRLRALFLKNLANLLAERYPGCMSPAHEAHASILGVVKAGWDCSKKADPSTRIHLGLTASFYMTGNADWVSACAILEEAIQLVPLLSPRILSNTDKELGLREFSGVASIAAAVALNAGKSPGQALQMLELASGVITGLLTEMRSSTDELERKHPQLAARFIQLRDQLDSDPTLTDLSLDIRDQNRSLSCLNTRYELDESLSDVIQQIRGLAGFERFLLPLTPEDMMTIANQGPVVVLSVSAHRCDAFIIKADSIAVLNLPDLNIEDAHRMDEALTSNTACVLEWLWAAIAEPVLSYLEYNQTPSDGDWPHIWWIPGGFLARFPIHAAGNHANGSKETVLDRVVSSYSTSLRALAYGRRHHVRRRSDTKAQYALLVAMPETPGQSALPFASKEVDMLRELCPSLHLQQIELAQPTKAQLLKHLKDCQIFHFAGHGLSDNEEPSESCLLLEDWANNRLTVGSLRDLKLQENAPFLAYLSACSTGANTARRLQDEGIHLINSCQLAGFRHVIGTLWEVSDFHCVEIARSFYKFIRDHGILDHAVALGLHMAMRKLRDMDREPVTTSIVKSERDAVRRRRRKRDMAWYWVPYVHFGV
ncbi:CHAT domain-containing protein [Aspergillus pseudotamarii]|uniref:CHAT domain-containing protein n=1 Tax=Aspergillus pseudotamarii TaxID=132259 RepID=A0A5N6T733_ASPPS|nr:CHAT domain-containing protein [Aspergillus pseudotamarii]KAE8142046.1 CHAT domain-containing protein [Aspergillus pseudotamarii]